MSPEVLVTLPNGRINSGPWEQTFYWEFDARRGKRVLIKISRE
jgi:thiamine phosphate synthase YjbQ (UPF0047 family)